MPMETYMLEQKPRQPAKKKQRRGTRKGGKELGRMKSEEASWEQGTLKKSLEKLPESKTDFTTPSGVPIQRLYTPNDTADLDYQRDLGMPGEYPYTRGV